MLIQEPVHATIWHCLNHYDYKDATFLAELLYTEVHSDESLHLLATCYYRSGKLSQAYDILQKNGARTPQCKFLMAKCCYDLNKLAEAEAVLVGDDDSPLGGSQGITIEKVTSEFGDTSAFALQVLARIYASTERISKGTDTSKAALQINPFLWSSFEACCNSDCSDVELLKLFDVTSLKTFSQCFGVNPILNYANRATKSATGSNFTTQKNQTSENQYPPAHVNRNIRHGSSTSTPLLPSGNIPNNPVTTILTEHNTKNQIAGRQQPPPQISNNQENIQEADQQSQLMTTMITPVNQMIFESTEGSIGMKSDDSCLTGTPMSEKCGVTGVGQLNFSIDSDSGNTPQWKDVNAQVVTKCGGIPSSVEGVKLTGPGVTVTPSTPMMYTPSPDNNIRTGKVAQKGTPTAMPPPVRRPKHKKPFFNSALNSSGDTSIPVFSKKLNLMSLLKCESRNTMNSSFGFLPSGNLKWATNASQDTDENSPLPALSMELSPEAIGAKSPYSHEISMTPVQLETSSDAVNVESSPFAILTTLSRSNILSTTDIPPTNISNISVFGKDISATGNNILTTTNSKTDSKATTKRASLQTHSLNTNMAQTTGILNSQNITPTSQINHGNVVGADRLSNTVVSGGANQHNTTQSPRRSERFLSARNQQSSTKSSKENTVSRPVGMLSSNISAGLPSAIDRGPTSEGRVLLPDRVSKLTNRNIKSPARNKTNPSNKTGNRLAENNEKNRQQGRHQIEKEPEDKDKSDPPKGVTDSSTQKIYNMATLTVEELKEQQRILSEQAMVIQKASVEGLMELLRVLGYAYLELTRYNNQNAIKILQEDISFQHRGGAFVQGLLGKAHFELAEYKDSVRHFNNMRSKDPHRLHLTEYFSTALWHLQEEVELSVLAQELTRIDKYSPQAWCAAGNCFSIQKEHENAIKFFQRAVQVDPNFAYAYTLLGHEYVNIEELDKALSCYRSAVRVDPRHYNAWYGIGLTYYKQERYQLAEIYYRKALAINPKSPILIYHVAVVQHALQKSDKALETLNAAIKLAPKNPIGKFERASILFSLERYNEALDELNQLKQLVPKESSVFFLIGKVHSKLGNTHLALMHISWAMDLDPKGANSQIKDALDPTMHRAGQEDVSSSVPPSGVAQSASTTVGGSTDNNSSQLLNVSQATGFNPEESNIDQSSLMTDEAGPSSMHQSSLNIDASNELPISRSRDIHSLIHSDDNLADSAQHGISNEPNHREEHQIAHPQRVVSNILNVPTEDDISSPDDLSRESGSTSFRTDEGSNRNRLGHDMIDSRAGEDSANSHATNDFVMEDLPPLRATSTSSFHFYQQREDNTLLAPELLSSPMPIAPTNIRTNTTGTSPTRPFENPSSSFHQFRPNQDIGIVDNIAHQDSLRNNTSNPTSSRDEIAQAVLDRTTNVTHESGIDESL